MMSVHYAFVQVSAIIFLGCAIFDIDVHL